MAYLVVHFLDILGYYTDVFYNWIDKLKEPFSKTNGDEIWCNARGPEKRKALDYVPTFSTLVTGPAYWVDTRQTDKQTRSNVYCGFLQREHHNQSRGHPVSSSILTT